ncbi:unnamed protein product [Eruca vesicaria subsp. sativa]|nr:unnamed protein product [Eruca vesicaria subsp. sativa]
MEWTIGSRIKTRNQQRLEEVKKRKPVEEEAAPVSSHRKRKKKRRRRDHDSDIEDITDTYNKNVSAADNVSHNNISSSDGDGGVRRRRRRRKDHDSDIEDITETYNKDHLHHDSDLVDVTVNLAPEVAEKDNLPSGAEVTESEQNVEEDLFRVRVVEVDMSVPGSSGLSIKEKLSDTVLDLDVGKTVPTSPGLGVAEKFCEDENLDLDVVKSAPDSSGLGVKEKLCEDENHDLDVVKLAPNSSGLGVKEKLCEDENHDLDVVKSAPNSSGLGVKEKLCEDENLDLDVVKTAPNSSGLGVKENLCEDENLDLDVVKTAPSSSGLSVKEKLSDEVLDLDVVKSVPSSSESSIKQKLFDEIMDVIKSAASSSGLSVKEKLSEEMILDVDVVKPVPKLSDEIVDVDVVKSVPSSSGSSNKENDESLNSDVVKSVTSSSGLRHGAKENTDKCSSETRGVGVVKPVPAEIEIISDSESETEVRHSAKKKLSFAECSRVLDTSSESSEEEGATNTKDDVTVESLSSSSSSSSSSASSSSSSSSSSEDEISSKEVVGESDDDDDDVRKRSSPIRKVSKVGRKPLGRFKRAGPSLIKPQFQKIQKLNHPEEEEEDRFQAKPIKEFKRIQKLKLQEEEEERSQAKPRKEDKTFQKFNHREEEDRFQFKPRNEDTRIQKFHCPEEEQQHKEVERVKKQNSNVVFTCEHCGKENTGMLDSDNSFIRPHAITRGEDDDNDLNNFVSPNDLNTEKAPEKPSTSRPETENPKAVKEVIPPARLFTSIPETVKEKEIQAPEMPPRPEVQFSLKTRMPVTVPEVLNTPALVNEPMDNESASSISSGDESGYDSEPSQKEKEAVKSNSNAGGWRMLDGSRKEVDLFRLLVNSVRENDRLGEEEDDVDVLVSSPEDQAEEQEERRCDDDGWLIIRPPPLIENFGVEEPQAPPVLSEAQIEEEKMWEELAFYTKANEDDLQLHSEIEKEIDDSPAAACRKGNHDLCLDLEIGMKCIHCSVVVREIRGLDISEWGERNTSGRRKTDRSEEEGNSNNIIGNLEFEANGKNSLKEGCVSTEGTVWDKIPGVKSQMYPHQQEGFEFIWRNLAGTIMLNELKDFENSEETGGCIMSHAPGTGKTRLTIIFLQAYLECFPNCKPVIIAPASLLLTWAEEFKKWNISIPFHNLSSLEFTGRENSAASKLLMQKNSSARSMNEIRMVKIYSWIKSKSILGISYNLYEKLAGVKDEDKKTKSAREMKPDKELEDIREILMGVPGLLVLDEAHTPRNQRSCIWKTLSKVETQKRILLSGTPFQNNFQELCNVLGLARPKYLERLTATLKKSGMTVTKRGKRALGDEINNRGIEELKAVMLPFVHVHKGSILQKSLPGLRECVVVLNPPDLQRKVLESIEVTHNQKTKNVFETEHKLSLVSVHPSLVSHCKLTGKEKMTINETLLAQLKKVRLDPNQSVKTRFLMEFIKLCVVIKEKVLVFSQYIDPLKLIMKHLVNWFKWTEGEEVLYMHGKLEQKQRQTLINEFNDPKSKAKVLLASTKACSEGINLVGASRVILLDVVWNPAVERQAISRAYRIGQKRIVYTYHLVAKGTPEGPKYCKQAQKDRISELVFACSSRPDKGKEKIAEAVTEDKVLDTMVKHLKLGDMFDNLIVQPKEADLVEGFSILMP